MIARGAKNKNGLSQAVFFALHPVDWASEDHAYIQQGQSVPVAMMVACRTHHVVPKQRRLIMDPVAVPKRDIHEPE